MKIKYLFYIIIFISFIISSLMHSYQYKKIKEFDAIIQLQSEIETKRTALFLAYQNILQNVTQEVNKLRKNKDQKEKENFSKFINDIKLKENK